MTDLATEIDDLISDLEGFVGPEDYDDGVLMSSAQLVKQVDADVTAGRWPMLSAKNYAFEARELLKNGDELGASRKLNHALNFVVSALVPSLRKDRLSYRSALKKFSNSIVFSDLGINLMLVKDDHSVELLEPDEVNGFLMDLNRYIISSARDLDE